MKISKLLLCSFVLCLLGSMVSCGDDDADGGVMTGDLALTDPCQYSITFGGEQLEENGASGDPFCSVTSFNTSNASGRIVIVGASLADFDSGEGFYFSIGSLSVPTSIDIPSDEDFVSLFDPGTYNFTEEADGGVSVEYQDADNITWSSSNGDQSGSSFQILESVSGEVQSTLVVTARAQYSCLLYNNSGESRMSSGQFTLSFQNF